MYGADSHWQDQPLYRQDNPYRAGNPYEQISTPYGTDPDQTTEYDDQYELPRYPYQGSTSPSLDTLSQADFLERISTIDSALAQLTSSIQQLCAAQSRLLASEHPSTPEQRSRERQLAATHAAISTLRTDMTQLQRDLARTPRTESVPRSLKHAQLRRVKAELRARLAEFQRAEAQHVRAAQAQIARQFRIVNPEASEADVQRAVEDGGRAGGVFQQALLATRSSQAGAVLAAVQTRQADVEQVLRTVQELAAAIQELDQAVQEQDGKTAEVERVAGAVVEELESGNKELAHSTAWARKLRRHKWMCVGVAVLVVLVLAAVIAVAVHFGVQESKKQ